MISKSFLKSSIIYTIGGALPIASSLILLPFYTNYLSDIQFTQVTFYISISLLLQILFSYSIESYFGIKYTQLSGEPQLQKRFIGTVSILLLIIGVVLLILTSLTGNFIFTRIFNPDYQMQFWPYGFFSVITAFFNSYFKTTTNSLIYLKKPRIFLLANFINMAVTLIVSIGGLKLFPDSIVGPIYGRLISGIVIFIIAQSILNKYGEFKYEKAFIKDLTGFCTPYIFYVLSVWVLSQIDRYVLQSYISNTDLNTYDLVLKCFFGIEFLQNSLSAVIFPKLYEIWNSQEKLHTTKESNRYFNVFTAINIMLLIVFCIAIPLVYKLVVHNAKFYESDKYIGILAAGYALRSVLNFYLSTILFTKSTLTLLKIYGISAVVHVVLMYFLIVNLGLTGAIYSGLLIKALQVILSALYTKNIFHYEFNYFKIIVIPVIYILINIVQFHIVQDYEISHYLIQLVIFTFIFYFSFKKEIRVVINQFIKA